MIPANVQKLLSFGYKTATAGTIIQINIPALTGFRVALVNFIHKVAATAHTVSLLYPATINGGHAPAAATLLGSKNTTSAAAAAAQAVVNVTNTPTDPAGNAAAANDVVAYKCSDGTWEFNTIASVATKAITLNTNLAKAVASGAEFRILGVVADGFCQQLSSPASATTQHGDEGVLLAHPDIGEPAVIQIDNPTNASFLLSALVAYINK